jgi:hypothetical protein
MDGRWMLVPALQGSPCLIVCLAQGRPRGAVKAVKILKEYGAPQALDFSLRLAVENLN